MVTMTTLMGMGAALLGTGAAWARAGCAPKIQRKIGRNRATARLLRMSHGNQMSGRCQVILKEAANSTAKGTSHQYAIGYCARRGFSRLRAHGSHCEAPQALGPAGSASHGSGAQ